MTSSHRRPLALAIAAAAVLGATAFVLPATAAGGGQAPAAVAAAPTPIVNGTLDWGVLASYRSYVLNIAKGTITPADGAALNSDGTFRFGSATGRYDKDGGHVVTAAFKGSVTFDAPAHGFKVTLANLRFDTGTKKLTADVTKNGTLTPGVPLADVAFGGPAMDKLGTTLTKEAAEQLGSDKYVGLAGDPLTAALEFAQPSPSPSPSATTSAPVSPSASAPSTGAAPSQSTGSPAADGPQQLVGGRLTWGVKDSFRSYVVKGGGSVTPAGGAVASGDTFAFALGKGELDTAKQKLSASFAGSLRFQRADHGVDMTFANLRVNAEGKKGTLVLDVKTPTATKADVPFATLDLSKTEYRTTGGLLTLNAVPAAFTAEGAAAIGAPSPDYAEGKPTDPVTLSVSVDKDAVLPTGTPTTAPTATPAPATAGGTGGAVGGGGAGGSIGGNLASTGAELPATALLAASGAAVVAGAGAVHLARRRRSVRM
ncbi:MULTISPECIES: HtaA domain-containing protein [unclassified Streptomyces]|uniref:HtaA domain-containing protein n=1 Tax=unclassified Streptomyces TaxID=2593676 RepID=UPI002E2CFD1F|nr:HtaA domain-containing protein [Streptomyces sp. NBC_00272]